MAPKPLAAALIALALFILLAPVGCNADPQDTHIHTGMTAPR